MRHGRLLAGVVLATALVVPLAGCATGKVRLSLQKMCEAHGGAWSQAQETCGMSTAEASRAARQAKDICTSQSGVYLPGGTCEFEGQK
jgi:hypothetical protein